jgi:small subunit ribosomal protein S16
MVKIRLSPKGKKGQRSYWVIAIDSREPRDSGNFLEKLGHWKPAGKKDKKGIVKLDKDNIEKRLAHGAQLTEAVRKLLEKSEI